MFAGCVAVLGTGLIGGSIGLGLRAAAPELEVVGFDADPASARAALDRGAVTRVAPSATEALAGADLVVLAAPVDATAGMCAHAAPHVEPDAAVTDVGSAKAGVLRAGEEAFGGRFVGGHPMAGSERHGIEAADGRLFEGAPWILTPTDRTSSTAYSRVSALVSTLGARVIAVAPSTHDSLVARLSHLPQLAASTLVDVAAGSGDRDALLGLAGRGFRDVTRIAASRPELWVAILAANREPVLEALDEMGDRLGHVRSLVAGGRWDELGAFLDHGRRARLELFAKPDYGGEPVALSLVVPDRPGVLAEVTRAAGELHANIEDLRIVHSTEGGRGRLELVVAGAEAAELLVAALAALGYHVDRGDLG